MEQRSEIYGVRLTRREKEILNYIVEGLRRKQIAGKLSISENTVANHRKKVLKKKGVRTCRQLIGAALDSLPHRTALAS